MTIEHALYDTAKTLVEQRYPTGWGGAAALRTESGRILTSVAPEIHLEALALCMEVGAILEAHKLNEAVTHSLCLYRKREGVFKPPVAFVRNAYGIGEKTYRWR